MNARAGNMENSGSINRLRLVYRGQGKVDILVYPGDGVHQIFARPCIGYNHPERGRYDPVNRVDDGLTKRQRKEVVDDIVEYTKRGCVFTAVLIDGVKLQGTRLRSRQ